MTKHKTIYLFSVVILGVVLLGLNSSYAGELSAPPFTGDTTPSGGEPFEDSVNPFVPSEGLPSDLGALIQEIFKWSLMVLGIAVFVMMFFAGFIMLTAAGNTAKWNDAKSKMTNALFGAILLLSAYLILYTINPDFVKNTFNLPGLKDPPSSK